MGKINVSFWLEEDHFDKDMDLSKFDRMLEDKKIMIPYYNEEMKFKPYRIIDSIEVMDGRSDINIYLEEIKENEEIYRSENKIIV